MRLTFSRPIVLALAGLAAACSASAANAASFDCARTRVPDEKAICADRALNDKDVKMALMFTIDGHFMAMGRRGAMQDDQVNWLHGRRACGANRQCLNAAYDHRLAALQSVLDEIYTHGPF